MKIPIHDLLDNLGIGDLELNEEQLEEFKAELKKLIEEEKKNEEQQ